MKLKKLVANLVQWPNFKAILPGGKLAKVGFTLQGAIPVNKSEGFLLRLVDTTEIFLENQGFMH